MFAKRVILQGERSGPAQVSKWTDLGRARQSQESMGSPPGSIWAPPGRFQCLLVSSPLPFKPTKCISIAELSKLPGGVGAAGWKLLAEI